MEFYTAYKEDVREVFKDCRTIIETMPSPYCQLGMDYIDRFHPERAKQVNYICYMLPFWLKEEYQLDLDETKILAQAGVFTMLCGYIQDKIIDGKDITKCVNLLPLSNLLITELFNLYERVLPGNISFLSMKKQCFNEYAMSITYEKEDLVQNRDLLNNELTLLAQKSAPIKLTAYAACVLSKKEQLYPYLEKQINNTLITLQLLDDWIDKYKDFDEGNYTHIINEIMAFHHIKDIKQLTKEHINRAVYFSNIIEKIEKVSKKNHEEISKLSNHIHVSKLVQFHERLVEDIAKIKSHVNDKKKSIIQGGFHNMLYK